MSTMADESLLVYEQDEVQLFNKNDRTAHLGKLRIIEKDDCEVYIEWYQNVDDPADNEWAVINACESPSKDSPETVIKNNVQKVLIPVSCDLQSIHHCKLTNQKKKLELFNKYDEIIFNFHFHKEHGGFFFDVLDRYVTCRQNESDPYTYILQNKRQAKIDDELSALDLVTSRYNSHNTDHHHWVANAPKKVWGFIHNLKKDPYNTTLSTLSKVYDVVLYGDMPHEVPGRQENIEVADLLHCISTMDDIEPGFEVLTKKQNLAPRKSVERLGALTHEEFKTFVDQDGKIEQVEILKQRIFKGGIHPNLRAELWCYLLGYYEWNMSYSEIQSLKREKEEEYYIMKQQWKTISERQEMNFSGFRDRKSIIEKDVNRTDRTHPFYEGDPNQNLVILNDILMTYTMLNFDLGYVQGMSDLLAPILYVAQNEVTAFWCFVGYMNRVYRNFDLDQSGMKQQLTDLTHIIRVLDPEFLSFLEAQESANFYFCFRWLLVRFKRELSYADTMRLWEVLWTDHLCSNFHLCVAVAILDTERDEIVEKKFGFTDVLKHINGLTLNIDLESTLRKAESIYYQILESITVSTSVRSLLNMPALSPPIKSQSNDALSEIGDKSKASQEIKPLSTTVRFSMSKDKDEDEDLIEKSISFSYL